MKALLEKIRKLLKDKRFRKTWYRLVSGFAAIVVFVTTYALVLPAITLEKTAACGIEEHQHDDSCYEERLICGQEESDGHHHDDSCYKVEKKLVCEQEEHQHSEENGCYDEEGNLICELPEHTHDDSCYEEVKTLICGQEESEGHHHTDACYEKVLVCGKEAHTHSNECYKEDSSAVAATEAASGGASTTTAGETVEQPDAADQSSTAPGTSSEADPEAESAGDAESPTEAETVTEDETASEAMTDTTEETAVSENYVPELDPVYMDAVLTKNTGFYYFHAEEDEEIPANSAEITDWQEVKKDTELASTDLVKMYLAYKISAGSLNETNPTARYRLPGNIHLTDEQIEAINKTENGVYASMDSDTDARKYLGAEAVEGSRRPDEILKDGAHEYISAVVRVENVYDDDGEYLGQDLIFTFVPYSIEKNQNTYDADGSQLTAGEKITGWFACDFNMSQIDWMEEEQDPDNSTIEKSAEIILVEKDDENGIKEISTVLKLTEKAADSDEDADGSANSETAEAAATGETAETASTGETAGAASTEETEETAAAGETAAGASTEETAEASVTGETAAAASTEKTADASEAEKAEETKYKSGILEDSGEGYRITLQYREDACIPENAYLKVTEITSASDEKAYSACLAEAESRIAEKADDRSDGKESVVDKEATRFFDIEILVKDERGNIKKIEPAANVLVNIQTDEITARSAASDSGEDSVPSKPSVLHFTDDGAKQMHAQASLSAPSDDSGSENESKSGSKDGKSREDKASQDPGIQFVTDSFSVYGVVYSTLRTTVLTASGETYEITVYYDSSAEMMADCFCSHNTAGAHTEDTGSAATAGIPEGSELKVREIESGTEEYNEYLSKSAGEMSLLPEEVAFARFFDIEIVHDGQKIEPETPVYVQIEYKDGMQLENSGDLTVVHFGQDGMEQIRQIGVSEDGKKIVYSQSSFSVTGTVVTQANAVSNHTYVVVVKYGDAYYSVDNDGYLSQTTYNAGKNTVTTSMPMLWTYYKNGTQSYLRHASTAKHIDAATQVADQWYYRYIDPNSATGLSEESGSQDLSTSATITYSDADKTIKSSSNNSYRIGVKSENGKLKICGQEEGTAAEVMLADVTDYVPGVNPNKDTVSHIDISIEGIAEIDVPLAYGTYYYADNTEAFTVSSDNQKTITLTEDVPINTDDMKNARITAFKKNANGEKETVSDAFYITGYSANSATAYSTQQVRIEGSFKVADVPESVYESVGGSSKYPRGNESSDVYTAPYTSAQSLNNSSTYRQARLDNRIYYNVAATKTITFTLVDENGTQLFREKNGVLEPITITADVTLSASFDYWDSRNECPPLQYYWQWQQGGIYDWSQAFWGYSSTYSAVSGMDFVLGGDTDSSQAHISAVEITKILVDEQGNRISPDSEEAISNTFLIYSKKGVDDSSVVGLDVGKYTTPANYDGYTQVDTRNVSVGSSGLGAIYDYDVPEGMVYIKEDPGSITEQFSGAVEDGDSTTWNYRNTYIETEYVWRQNGDQGTMHVSDTYKNTGDAYASIPEVLGSYSNTAGGSEWNGFLEFYVYNVYDSGKTDIEMTKKWWDGFDQTADDGDITITVNNQTYTYKKSDLRVDMKLTQYIDGVASQTLQDASGVTDTITLDGTVDEGENLTQGELSKWVATWKDLPTKSASGDHTYTYKVTESKVYTATNPTNLLDMVFVSTASEDGLMITNKPIASKTKVHIKKYWEGVNEAAGITIPADATIDVILGRYKLVGSSETVSDTTLSAPTTDDTGAVIRYISNPNASDKVPEAPESLKDSWKYAYDSDFSVTKTEILINSNRWEADIENLDETDPEGHPYAYFIQGIIEHGLEEGTSPVIELESNGRVRTFSSTNNKDLLVTNTLPTYKSVSVTKTWKDENGKSYVGDWPEEMRDKTLKFTLYKGTGSNDQTTTWKTGTITYDKATGTGTTYTFKNLPEKDSDGNDIVYTVVETGVSGFTPSYAYDDDGNVTVTNTKIKAGLRVEKKWRGVPDASGFPTVYFTLYRTTDLQNANNPEVVNGYNNVALSNENNWTWVCPIDLPAKDGNNHPYLYFIQENSQGSGLWSFHYYSNSSGQYTTAWNQGHYAGIQDDESGIIEGTLTIHNKLNSYANLDIRKENFYTYDNNNQRTDSINSMKQNTVIGVKVLRRIKFSNGNYTEWEDYGDEMLVGYVNGQAVSRNGENDFYLQNNGDWYWQIFDQGGGYLDDDKIGLPTKGYYVQNGNTIEVTYEYDIRETGVYKDLDKTPYDDWEWYSVKEGNVLKNYLASDFRIEKNWVGKAGGKEIYVKVFRKKVGSNTVENFTDIIASDVSNGNREGYVDDTSLVTAVNGENCLVIKNNGTKGGTITIKNVPINEIKNDASSAAAYQYYAVEVGYKDNSGTVHWTSYNNDSDGFNSDYLGDLAKFDPAYKIWDSETGTWESVATNDPTEKAQLIGEVGTNRVQITNTSRMEMDVQKIWEGLDSSEIPESITFRIEQTRTPYENGQISGNSSKSDLYFTVDSNAVNYLTITKDGNKTAKLEATGRVNYYKLSYIDADSATPWKLKVDGLQEVFVGASGVEYHCSYKIMEVDIAGCTTTYSVLDTDGQEISGEQYVTESGQTAVITNKKANAEIVIKKIKQKANPGDADEFISGAKFELWKKANASDTNYTEKVTQSVLSSLDANDQFTITSEDGFKLENLADGEYQIVEKEAPEGYVILNNKPVTFKIEGSTITQINGSAVNRNSGKITLANSVEFTPADAAGGTKDTFAIPNTVGVELPSTGGSGTHLFYLLGAMLLGLAGAGYLLKMRRRNET